MLKKIFFSLIIGLFSIVTLSSGAYVMNNEISSSLSATGNNSFQDPAGDNNDLEQDQNEDDKNDENDESNKDDGHDSESNYVKSFFISTYLITDPITKRSYHSWYGGPSADYPWERLQSTSIGKVTVYRTLNGSYGSVTLSGNAIMVEYDSNTEVKLVVSGYNVGYFAGWWSYYYHSESDTDDLDVYCIGTTTTLNNAEKYVDSDTDIHLVFSHYQVYSINYNIGSGITEIQRYQIFTRGYDIELWKPYDYEIYREGNRYEYYEVQYWEIDGVKYRIGQNLPSSKANKNLTAYARFGYYIVTADPTGGTISNSSFGEITNLEIGRAYSSSSNYGFAPNSNGYYESQNKGVANSCAIARVEFTATANASLTFTFINSGESGYDYGMLGKLDTWLSNDNNVDESELQWSGKTTHSTSAKTIIYNNIPAGRHYIFVKYRKDGTQNNGNDSFQFKVSGGWASNNTKYVQYNMPYGDLPTATKTGYAFKGWYTAKTGGSQITATSKFTSNSDQTIYAQWEEATYMIDVNIMSPSGEQDYQSGTMTYYNSTWGQSQSNCTDQPYGYLRRSGYIQLSNIQPAVGMHVASVTCNHGTITQNGSFYIYRTNLTSDASGSWDDIININMAWNTYKVRYHYRNSSGTSTYVDHTYTYNTEYSFYSASNLNFYNSYNWQFSGWTNSANSETEIYSGGSKFCNLTLKNNDIVNVYAIYKRTVSLVYEANGGTGTTANTTGTQYGNLYSGTVGSFDIQIASNNFIRSGYTFLNWNLNANGTGASFTAGAISTQGNGQQLWTTYTSNATQKLIANWGIVEYTVTIRPFYSDNGGGKVSYKAGVPAKYTVSTTGGSRTNSVDLTSAEAKTLSVNAEYGNKIVVNHNLDSQWQLMGIYTYQTTPNMIQSNPQVTVMDESDTNIYVYFARNSENKLKYTSDNGGYFYFEDGYFPQSMVTGVATSGTPSGKTYNIAGTNIASYMVNGQEYVYVKGAVFKVEPIRWRISEYGTSINNFPSRFADFGSYYTNFSAVSDLVLNVGSAMTKQQFDAKQEDGSWKDWSMINSALPDLTTGTNVRYAKPSAQEYQVFGGIGNTSVVSGFVNGPSTNVNIVSTSNLIWWLSDTACKASGLVQHLLNCGTYANYWTTDLGSQYGAGKIRTASGELKDLWLHEQAGVRFAMTFTDGVRHMGEKDTYQVIVKDVYNGAVVKVYNSDETVLKDTYTNIVNNQIALNVSYDDVIVISNLVRNGYDLGSNGKIFSVTGTSGNSGNSQSGLVTATKFRNLNDNNGCVKIQVLWTMTNNAINYYDRFSFSYNHAERTVSVRAANTNISGEIVIPDVITHHTNGLEYTITKISASGFQNCKNITSVILPDTILDISSNSFYGCSNLKQIKLSKNLVNINSAAFDNCINLTSISIPASTRKISSAFFGCTGLKYVNFEGTLKQWATEIALSFYTPTLYSKNLYIKNELVTSVDFTGTSITKINNYAFRNVASVTSLKLPNTVKLIDRYAFADCVNMVGSFNTSITSVGEHGFEGCSKLTGTVGALQQIDGSAFSGCVGLTSITLASNITMVGAYAFSGCSNLKNTYFQGTVAQWASIYFWSELSNPVMYSKNLIINGSNLTSVNLAGTGITKIGAHAFTNLTNITSLTLPTTLTRIESDAFRNCAGITGSLIIPDSVTYIGTNAFSGCQRISSVVIGNGVKQIYSDSFKDCRSMVSLKLGNSTTDIYSNAFRYCYNLRSVYLPSTVSNINCVAGSSPFYGCSSLKIYCGASSKPSGFDEYWDTWYYRAAFTDANGYHPLINYKISVYWGYTYSQYQNATGGGILTESELEEMVVDLGGYLSKFGEVYSVVNNPSNNRYNFFKVQLVDANGSYLRDVLNTDQLGEIIVQIPSVGNQVSALMIGFNGSTVDAKLFLDLSNLPVGNYYINIKLVQFNSTGGSFKIDYLVKG